MMFLKNVIFHDSQKQGMSHFFLFSSISQSILLIEVSFERENRAEQDASLVTSRQPYLVIEKFGKSKKGKLSFEVFGKKTIVSFCPTNFRVPFCREFVSLQDTTLLTFLEGLDSDQKCRILRTVSVAKIWKCSKLTISLFRITGQSESKAREVESFLFRGFGVSSGWIFKNNWYLSSSYIDKRGYLNGSIFCHFLFAFIETVDCCSHTRSYTSSSARHNKNAYFFSWK